MSKTIQVNGGNLFQIALEEYGDATLWTVIAQANRSVLTGQFGILDYMVQGSQTLLIPDVLQNSNTGGVISG